MDKNVKRFGGEIEFANVEIKDSTYKARQEFFDILNRRQPQVFDELLRLFNPNSLPNEFRNNWKAIDLFTNFFFRRLKKQDSLKIKWSEFKVKSNISETPLMFYFEYLSKKKSEIKKFSAETEERYRKYNMNGMDKYIEDDGIKGLIPDWKTIQKDSEAKAMCKSLIDWAKKYNIYESWIIDYALIKLRKFKILIDDVYLLDFDTNDQYNFSQIDFDSYKRKIWNDSISSYIFGSPNVENPFSYMELEGHTEFNFYTSGIKLNDKWHPLSTSRQMFIESVERDFIIQSQQKLELIQDSNDNLDSFIEKIQEIKSARGKLKKSLKDYCSQVLKIQLESVVKTPVKKSGDKHFEWLVDFQINNPIEKSYEDIAKENKIENSVVRKGVESVGKLIGLKLRPAPKTGRPKGVNETKERGNYSRW